MNRVYKVLTVDFQKNMEITKKSTRSCSMYSFVMNDVLVARNFIVHVS